MRNVCSPRPASPRYVVRARYRLPPEKRPAIASTEAAILRLTLRSTSSPSDGFGPIPPPPPPRNLLPHPPPPPPPPPDPPPPPPPPPPLHPPTPPPHHPHAAPP